MNRATTRGWPISALFVVTAMGCAAGAGDEHDGVARAQQAASEDGDQRAPDGSAKGAALLGRYVTRLQSFWVSPNGVRAVRELGLAEFAKVGDDIVLRTRICAQRTSLTGYQLDLYAPDALPDVVRKVQIDGSHWQTEAQPVVLGYARDGVSACVGHDGQAIDKLAVQTWLTGATCQCPSDPTVAPAIADCRIDDPDRDQGPGLTYILTGPEGLLRAEYYAGVVRSHAVRGVIDPEGAHRAEWKLDEAHYRLACWPGNCGPSEGTEAPCTSEVNRLELKPLPNHPSVTEWDCAAVRGHETILFPEPYPTTPASCVRDTSTDSPR